jgi:hypothetical protein
MAPVPYNAGFLLWFAASTYAKGLHVMHMEELLAKEGVTGRLKGGKLPPHNSTEAWGAGLWHYLKQVISLLLLLEYLVCCLCGERSAVFREFFWKYRLEVVTTAVHV